MAQTMLPIEVVAGVTQRLAVLLSAGVSPPAAWEYLAEGHTDVAMPVHQRARAAAASSARAVRVGEIGAVGQPGRMRALALRKARLDEQRAAAVAHQVLQAAARAGAEGSNVSEAIRATVLGLELLSTNDGEGNRAPRAGALRGRATPPRERRKVRPPAKQTKRAKRPKSSERMQRVAEAWLALAAAWAVAQESGAPLASTLRQLAAAFRDQAQLERDLAVALSGPRATARMVGAMPAVGVVFGSLMGFDTVNTLLFTVPGVICLVLGSVLMFAGARWSGALVRQAARGLGGEGQLVELTAIAMTGGASTERAKALADGASERYAAAGAGVQAEAAVIGEVLALSRRAGIPAAELLRSEAQQARLSARSAGQQRAARLAVSLMIPLGLCVLPAFMLLGVVPLLISVLSSTLTFV